MQDNVSISIHGTFYSTFSTNCKEVVKRSSFGGYLKRDKIKNDTII